MLGYYLLAILPSVYLMGCNGAALGEACYIQIDCTGTYQYCDTTSGTCACYPGYIQRGFYCLAELWYGCKFDANCYDSYAVCSGSQCTCDTTTHYDSNGVNAPSGTCVNKIPYGGVCVLAGSCAGDNTECINGFCKCKTGYYHDNFECVIKISFGRVCTQAGSCFDDNTECIGGTCQCASGYSLNNWACVTNLAYGDVCSGGGTCTGVNQECRGGNCQCTSGYYWNYMACVIKVDLGESCSSNAACKGGNTKCGSSGKCECDTGYYDNTGTSDTGGTCVLKELLGTSCTLTTDCADGNAECSSQKCTCKSGYYDNTGTSDTGGTCIAKILLGAQCPVPTNAVPNTATCSDSKATCISDGSNYQCICPSDYYDSNGVNTGGGECLPKINLGYTCPNSTSTGVLSSGSCMDSKALCQLSGSTYICSCINSYYDDNGVNVQGGSCRFKLQLGHQCPLPTNTVPNTATCFDSIATCIPDGNIYKCLCPSDYYDSNGVNTVDGQCLQKKTLGSSCPNPSNTGVLSTDSCKDSNALCQGSGSTYICSCRSTYYDDNGVNVQGGSCKRKILLGNVCPEPTNNVQNTATCLDNIATCISDCNNYKCLCPSDYYDSNGVNTGEGQCLPKISRDSEAYSSNMTTIIVGVVLGVIILILLSCIGYLMVKQRRLSNQGQTKQPKVEQQPQYVNQMFLDVVSQSPNVENIPSPEDNYTSLNVETREDKSTYATFKNTQCALS